MALSNTNLQDGFDVRNEVFDTASTAAGPVRFSRGNLLTSIDDTFVLPMIADPKPDRVITIGNCQSSHAQAHSDGPIVSNLLEMQ